MATITSTAAGNWSAGGTWVGGVAPANGDSVVINHAVTFNVDTSGFASGIAGIVINAGGSLIASTSAGTYYLKLSGNVTGAGQLIAGSSGTPYPTTCTFTIAFNGNFSLQLSAVDSFQVYCAEPVLRYVTLTVAAGIGDTVLTVDGDVSADWANTNAVHVNNINTASAANSESRVISSMTSSTITLTVGLTTAKAVGSLIVLITRNVIITGSSSTTLISTTTGGGVFRAHYSAASASAAAASVALEVCGVVTGMPTVVGAAAEMLFTGVSSGVATTIDRGHYCIITNAVISGGVIGMQSPANIRCSNTLFHGCSRAVRYGGNNRFFSCTFTGNFTGALNLGEAIFTDCSFSNNIQDMLSCDAGYFENCNFASSVEHASYLLKRTRYGVVTSVNHDQTAGAYRAWTKGGVVTSVASPVFGTAPRSYQLTCEDANYPVFFEEAFSLAPNQRILILGHVRKSATMAYLPRVWVSEWADEPLVNGAGDLVDEVIMPADSVDTWETVTLSIQNTASYTKRYRVRFLAKNGSGNVFWDFALVQPVMVAQEETLLFKTGVDIPFSAFYLGYDGNGLDGLTVTVSVTRDGVAVVTDEATTDDGDGNYRYTLDSDETDTAGLYIAVFTATEDTVQQKQIVARAQVGGWLDTMMMGSPRVTLASPTNEQGNITVYQDADYVAGIGTQITWDYTGGLDLDSADSITFYVQKDGVSQACSFSSGIITLNLSAAQTDALSSDKQAFQIWAVFGSNQHPVVVGHIVAKPNYN